MLDIHVASESERNRSFEIRKEVFVRSQGVDPTIEFDGLDEQAVHIVALADGVMVGCVRMLDEGKGVCHPGRLAVLEEYRGRGIGKALMVACVDEMRKRGFRKVCIHAQAYLVGFYSEFGFTTKGDMFVEAGIDHYMMEYDLV